MAALQETWLVGIGGTKFYTVTYPAPSHKATLVFVHGFAEHVGRYDAAFRAWASRGITVFAFDQRGFGKTALDAEERSKDSAYGKTSLPQQLADVGWAIGHAKEKLADGKPVYLMGHSMGGMIVLSFATRAESHKDALAAISGVISSSPLVLQTTPAPKLLRAAGSLASRILPNAPFDAGVDPNALSHDPECNAAYSKDPLVRDKGTLRGLRDMLDGGEQLLHEGYKHWPKTLPLLLLHGTDDKVCSYKASEDFFNKVIADDKKLSLYPGGYHELANEPDGVKEKFTEECIAWVESHVAASGTTLETAPAPSETRDSTTAKL